MPVNLGTAVGYLTLDISGFARSLDTAKSEMNGFVGHMNTSSGKLDTISKGLVKSGKILTAGVTAPIAGVGAAAIKSGSEFDAGMSKVKAITGDATVDMNKLYKAAEDMGISFKKGSNDSETAFNAVRAAAIKMGNDTKFTATETTDALYYMGLAGWKADEQIAGLPAVLNLAAASGVELGRTSDIVTDGLTAFGRSAEDSTEFVNALAAASANSNTNVDLLGESFKYVAPVAGGFGYTIQDTTLALGLMASAGVKGTQAGTSLRQALVQLTKPSDKAATYMNKYGVSLYDAQGNVKSLRDFMLDLRQKFGDLDVAVTNADGSIKSGEEIMEEYGKKLPISQQEKLTAITTMFGTRALPGILSIINAGQGDFNQLATSIDGADTAFGGAGYAAGQAGIMLDNLQGDVTLLQSAFGTTKIVISDMVSGTLREFIQQLTEILRKFNEMDPKQQEQIVKIAGIVAAIGPLLIIIGKVIGAISAIIGFISTIGGVLSTLGGAISTIASVIGTALGAIATALGLPVAAVAAIIAAVIALVAVIVLNFNKIKKFIGDVISGIIDFFKSLFSAIGKIIGNIIDAVQKGFTKVRDTISSIITAIKNKVSQIFNSIKTVISTVINAIKSVISTVFNAIKNTISSVLNAIKTTFSNIWNGIKNIVTNVINAVKNTISNGINGAKNVVTGVLNTIKSTFSNIFNGAVSIVKGAIDKIKSFFNFKWSLPKIKLPHFKIKGSFSLNPPSIPSFGVDWYKKAMRNGIIMNEPTIFGYDNTTGKFLAGGEAGSEVVVGTQSLLSMIKSTVQNAISGLLSAINGFAAAMLDAFTLTISSLSTSISDMSSIVGNTVTNNGNGIDYDLLVNKFIDVLRNAPIQVVNNYEVEDGDVYIDGERAGRKLAPIISRIQATS